jgi:hypothetical protein
MSNPGDTTSDTTREKLKRLLIRSVPGALPWVGDLWKDIIDEFTNDEVDAALGRLESLAHADLATQREVLIEVLRLRGIADTAGRFVHRMERREQTQQLLRFLLEMNWGNARFLHGMLQSPEGRWISRGVDLEFRKAYPNLLDKWAVEGGDGGVFPFIISMTVQMVAFPDGYEAYAWRFREPDLKPSNVPRLVHPENLGTDGKELYFEGARVREIPQLPLESGFIHGMDESTGLPIDVRNEPSDEYWGAFYWVQPTGLRSVVFGLGVADPLEARFGTAVWWDYTQSRPFFGITFVMEADTP